MCVCVCGGGGGGGGVQCHCLDRALISVPFFFELAKYMFNDIYKTKLLLQRVFILLFCYVLLPDQAFNLWLQIPQEKLEAISEVVRILHNSSLL